MGRNGSRSIKSQFHNAINGAFSEGTDKHSYKAENGQGMTDKVFSYSEKNRLLDMAKNLQSYIKAEDLGIKDIKDITPEVVQGFLNSKTETCTQNTINSYAESLYKLQNVANSRYKTCELQWRGNIAVPSAARISDVTRGVGNQIPEREYGKLIEYAKENYSQSGAAILLQDKLGIRIEELARIKLANIDLEKGVLTIDNAKGGKTYTRDINELKTEIKGIMAKEHDKSGVFLFSIKGSSINHYLRDTEDRIGMDRYSNHNIRSYVAQRHFDNCRESGMDIPSSIRSTSQWLNHEKGREEMLTKSYINIH